MKSDIALVLVVLCSFFSCKKENVQESSKVDGVPSDQSVITECYQSVVNKDTIALRLSKSVNHQISGNLTYKFFQKDKNIGTLTGDIIGDTLVADYTFISEGVSSMREVVFIKKGNTYVEGFGEIIDNSEGRTSYKNRNQLKFDGSIIITKVDCE